MIFSIRNINTSEYPNLDKIREVMFDATKYSPVDLIEIKNEFDGFRIVYDLSSIQEIGNIISDLKDIVIAVKGVVFRVRTMEDLLIMLENDFPVFCGPNNASYADSLDKMRILCEKGVTDVYIGGQLGFQMSDARALADRFGVYIRVIPNIANLSMFTFAHIGLEENLTSFWIRPDDIDLYEPYADIVEFYGKDEKQTAFYDIYAENKLWLGELGNIIVGLYGIDNRGLISDFTSARLNCGKKCLLDKCHSCFKYKILGNTIVENKLKIDD